MTDPPRHPETKELGAGPDTVPGSAKPRWLAVLGIVIVIALFAALVVLHLTGTLGPGTNLG